MDSSILWRRLDKPGHESARLISRSSDYELTGAAVFSHEGQPCRLDYSIRLDPEWRTTSGQVSGWVGDQDIEIELAVDKNRIWRLNGDTIQETKDCVDLDLNFSPSTNLLPIRRLNLEVGEEAETKAAWLRFPEFKLEPLEQIYRRMSVSIYRYETDDGKFVSDLTVNEAGFVTHYPGLWIAE